MLFIYSKIEELVEPVVEPVAVAADKLGKTEGESDFVAVRELKVIGLKASETVALLIYYNIMGIKMHLFNVLIKECIKECTNTLYYFKDIKYKN
jgi:hypothetical protein